MKELRSRFDFNAARLQRFLTDVGALMRGQQNTLLSFDEVRSAARLDGQSFRGLREIPVDQIRGTVGRVGDFDASFLPVKSHLRQRWARLDAAMRRGEAVPPIEVYQLGNAYFVKDGHHRVSVARHLGWEVIRAYVVEIKTRAPLDADVDPEDLLKVAEYASFLERTQLDRTRPEARLHCSQLGRYDVIYDHILGHRFFMSVDNGRDVPLREAAASWYDSVYRPVMAVAERHRLAEQLPGWTEADVYLALTRLRLDLDLDGRPAGPESAADALMTDAGTYGPQRSRGGHRTGGWNGTRRSRARGARRFLRVISGGRRRRLARSAPADSQRRN